MTWFSLRSGIASIGVSSTAYTPQSASPRAKIRTRKRLRMQYSMTFSIMGSAFLQSGNDIPGFLFHKLAFDLIAGLDAVQDFCVLDVEFHFHGLHQAGYILMVEHDCGFLWIHAYDLALDLVTSCRVFIAFSCRLSGTSCKDNRGKD